MLATVLACLGAVVLTIAALGIYKHYKDERDYAARWRGPYWRD